MLYVVKLMRPLLAVGLVLAALWLGNRPAWALSASAAASNYAGGCPGYVSFSGTISGTVGAVTYSFFYYDPGSGQTVSLPAHAIVVNNSASVSDSGRVTGSGSGWVQLMITSPGLVYSNKASFTVTCAGPPPPSAPPGGSLIASPSGLGSTNDPNTCNQHGDNVACAFGIQQGDLVLIFSWAGTPPLDGYKAYRVDGGQRTLVYRHTSGATKTVAFIDKTAGGFNGKCYAVTAYRGGLESSLSAPLCVGGGSHVGIETANIAAFRQLWFQGINGGNTGSAAGHVVKYVSELPSGGLQNVGSGAYCLDDPICVGFKYTTDKHWYGDDFNNQWVRSGIWFSVGSLHARNVWSATLIMNIADTHVGPGNTLHSDPTHDCLDKIEPATNAWWNGAQWISGDDSRALRAFNQSGTQVRVNVTSIVRRWVSGGFINDGFVLIGPSEDQNAFTEDGCETGFNNISLSIQFTS